MAIETKRQTFGIDKLDELLGGGLLPGKLTVIAGATGAGKTQLGLRWANQGLQEEGRRGVVCDLASRGDDQNHAGYANAQFNWPLRFFDAKAPLDLEAVWADPVLEGEAVGPFERTGRRVTKRDVEPEEWHEWKSHLAATLRSVSAFFYSHFAHGARRVVFDGIEPADRFADSIQFELFEYLYHRVIRQEHDWAAREVFREQFRANEPKVQDHRYEYNQIGCLYLYTTHAVMLDDLLTQPIGEGDVFANANTIVYLGRRKRGDEFARGLCVVKHRGSPCDDGVHEYKLTKSGVELV